MSQIHASAIAIEEQGILLRGPSGAGKSDLALRMIEQGAQLISDDRVELVKRANDLVAFAPPQIAGLLEVRHLGILSFHHIKAAPIRLVIDLMPLDDLERHPKPDQVTIDGVSLPRVCLWPFEVSATAKVGLALALALGHMERME